MRCKSCGGELRLANGIAVCQACSTSYTLDRFFEDTDVCICYIENDENGRRTKDSVIAQEVYRQLETRKINAFYERISADNVAGYELERMRLSAIYQAKIILVVGTHVGYFHSILEKYGQYFAGKMVIPVCADVKPNEIPRELSKIQALDYASIGWEKDLERGVLRILGREKEIDLLDVHQKAQKNRAVLIGVAAAVLLVAIGATLFGFANTKEKNIPTEQAETMATLPPTNQQIYEDAQSLVNEGKYLEAINAYSQIHEFKDSENQRKSVFNLYDGYYQDESQKTSLYINIIDGAMAEFTVDKIVDGKFVRIEETILLEDNEINGTYVDNLLNEGNVSIILYNDKVELKVSTEKTEGKISAGDVFVEFSLANKEDRPPIKEATKEILLDWVTNPTSPDDIRAAGYELEYIDNNGDYDITFGTQYKIINSDILVITSDIDLPKYYGQYENVPRREEAVVVAVIGPVVLLCPEKTGQSSCVFKEDNKMYVPYAYNITGPENSFIREEYLTFLVDEMNDHEAAVLPSLVIEKDGLVGIVSENIVGPDQYAYLWEIHKETYNRS